MREYGNEMSSLYLTWIQDIHGTFTCLMVAVVDVLGLVLTWLYRFEVQPFHREKDHHGIATLEVVVTAEWKPLGSVCTASCTLFSVCPDRAQVHIDGRTDSTCRAVGQRCERL